MKVDVKKIWEESKGPAGVSEKQLEAWEKKNGVRLPKVLREALTVRNGGQIRHNDFTLLPLEEFAGLEQAHWSKSSTTRTRWSGNWCLILPRVMGVSCIS